MRSKTTSPRQPESASRLDVLLVETGLFGFLETGLPTGGASCLAAGAILKGVQDGCYSQIVGSFASAVRFVSVSILV